jgi:CRISPR/Cas system CMR subunit Cmr4 (Cas7 group RAMP superfamily)
MRYRSPVCEKSINPLVKSIAPEFGPLGQFVCVTSPIVIDWAVRLLETVKLPFSARVPANTRIARSNATTI